MGKETKASDYEKLLDNVYAHLPEKKGTGERFEVPRVEVLLQGNKTIVKNFGEVCERLRRSPAELSKYLFKELAVPGVIEGGGEGGSGGARLILQSKFGAQTINSKIAGYCETNLFCKECGKPDTRIALAQGVKTLVCEACGARKPVR